MVYSVDTRISLPGFPNYHCHCIICTKAFGKGYDLSIVKIHGQVCLSPSLRKRCVDNRSDQKPRVSKYAHQYSDASLLQRIVFIRDIRTEQKRKCSTVFFVNQYQ